MQQPGATVSTHAPHHRPEDAIIEAKLPLAPGRDASGAFWTVWAIIAAFGTYFAMYGFRKPFTAASFSGAFGELEFKTIVVFSQVLGYTISKFVGVKVISEMAPTRRATAIVVLIGIAELALVGFGLVPRPWNAACLFINGLPLGMVFGLVMGFLEGRRQTELLAAGVCASFILADGAAKSLGAWILTLGVSDDWMPAVAGLCSTPPLLLGVFMLSRIPRPSAADEAARAKRHVMSRAERLDFFRRYAIGIVPLIVLYLLLTVLRSLRGDFAPELWRAMGEPSTPSRFTTTEMLVAGAVLAANGALVLIRSNRRAFFCSLGVCMVGVVILSLSMWGRSLGMVSPFWCMVLMGLGLYLPYAMVHTTVFERMLAMTRERANLGFLMYLADSIGYLGYVAVLLFKTLAKPSGDMFTLFTTAVVVMAVVTLPCLGVAWVFFARRGHERHAVGARVHA